jgi:tellurite resistance protein TerC
MLSVRKFRRKKRSPVWRRVIVFFIGGAILTIGVIMLVLPGPAIIFIPLGLAVLATEFLWARKWLVGARQWWRGRFQKMRRKGEPNRENSRSAN